MIGESLRRARRRAHLTQQQVAGRSGIDRAYISKLERGLHDPSTGTVERILQAIRMKGDEKCKEK